MSQDTQPECERPAILRLPQVPPLKVPARRQTRFMARPSPVRYTEQVPVTPPLTQQPQGWVRAPSLVNRSVTGVPVREYIPTSGRSRVVGNGEFLLGCAFLILMGLLAFGLLTWLSATR